MHHFKPLRAATTAALALGLAACAGGAYTGPVEVTRFVSQSPTGLGQGTIAVRFAEEMKNEEAMDAFRGAVSDQLSLLGYTIVGNEEAAGQIATVSTSRNPVEAAQRGNPVSVGVGGGAGTFGSGVGLGVGLNLGGNRSSAQVVSELAVAIASNSPGASAQNLWEARAQFPTSVNSPYSPVEVNARTLAAAIFKDFPGGDGRTVSLNASDLVEPQ